MYNDIEFQEGEDMKLFKHRGDIYIPSTKLKSDREQKILFLALAFILAFTVILLCFVGFKYDFSVKKFFQPKNLQNVAVEEEKKLPTVKGKTNYLYIMHNANTNDIYVLSLIQIDLDNLAYKVSTMKGETEIEGNKVSDIYKKGSAGNVVNAVSSLFGIEIDYFIDQTDDQYEDMFNYLGYINYTASKEIRYKDNSYYGFNIKLKEGNQKINGSTAAKLMRYYIVQEDYKNANEFMLDALSQQINPENYEIKEKHFSRFIEHCKTNITVRNFNEAIDAMHVLSDETTGVNKYSASPVYENNSIVSSSVDDIRGYFVKK